jgi:hypothetical protein
VSEGSGFLTGKAVKFPGATFLRLIKQQTHVMLATERTGILKFKTGQVNVENHGIQAADQGLL